MNHQEYLDLQAECNTLRRMLAKIPGSRVLSRASLEVRLEELEEKLADTQAPEYEFTKALDATRSLLDGSIGVDDEQLAEAAADVDQRAP